MINVNGLVVTPTIFPDGTSQIWKLPDGLFEEKRINIVWNFESERELIDLYGINALIPKGKFIHLHISYMPYARQDKEIGNKNTFNLYVFAGLLNMLAFDEVSAVDVHNPELTKQLIKNFRNYSVTSIHNTLIDCIKPDYLVFPDKGAADRYSYLNGMHIPIIVFEKYRHQGTGVITEHKIVSGVAPGVLPGKSKFLVIDDLCDGGATFISIATVLNRICSDPDLYLYVTHGGFSKGREVLTNVGYKLFTTNSLIRNVEGFKV
jgi:ribose-phosphate pyrophosphokinase